MSGSSSPASLAGSWYKSIDKETTANNRPDSRLSAESGLSGPDYRLVSGVENLNLESPNNQEVRNGHLFREPLSLSTLPLPGVQNPIAFSMQDSVYSQSENGMNFPPNLYVPPLPYLSSTDAHCFSLRQQIPPASLYRANPRVETSTTGCGEVLLPLLPEQQAKLFSQHEDDQNTTSVDEHNAREMKIREAWSGLHRTPILSSGVQFHPEISGYRPPNYRPSHTYQQFSSPPFYNYEYPDIRHIVQKPRFDSTSQQNVAYENHFGSQWPLSPSGPCYSRPDALSFHSHHDLQQNMFPPSLLIHAANSPHGDHPFTYPIQNQHPMRADPTTDHLQRRDLQQRLVDNVGDSSESSRVSGQETAPQSKTIQILGVQDEKKSFKCKYYFKNPDNGGGEIQEVKWDNIDYTYYITFSDKKVAERVASSVHNIDNQQLEISLAAGGIPESVGRRTIEISGGDVEFLEIYKLYFENPQNGGGPISNIRAEKETQKIFITFADASVVATVCRQQHQVEEHLLEATPAGIKHPTDVKFELEQPDEEFTTVEAIVGPQLKDEMFYRQYFEHYGSVEEIILNTNEGKVLVTFTSVEVACQVSSCIHQIDEKEVRVSLTKASTFYPDTLFFRNVPESATKELLKNYMENISGQDIINLVYSDESGELLVIFQRKIDSRKIREKCQAKPLCGVKLQVYRVPVSNCILVENLNPNTSDDDIAHYFESLRADGGAVLKVQPAKDDRIHVFFEDSGVAQRVATKKHRLGGRELGVRLRLECLGSSGGKEDPNVFALPEPLELSMICNTKVSSLQHNTAVLQTFNESLSQVHAHAKLVEDVLKVECTLDHLLPNAPFLASAWRAKVTKELESCFESMSLDRQDVIPAKEDIVEKMQSVFKDTSKKHVLKMSEVVEINDLKKHEIDLLNMSSFPSDIANQNDKLCVRVEEQEGKIIFHGELLDIREAQIKMLELFRSTPSMIVTNVTESKLSLLTSKECRDIIRKKLTTSGLIATWLCHDEGVITVYCMKKSDLHQAVGVIQSSFQEEVIPLDDVSFKVVALPKWEELKEYFIQENNVTLKISTQPNSIVITAISKQIITLVKKEIQDFVSNNAIYISLLRFSQSRQRFLALYWEEQLTEISEMLFQYQVSITLYDKKRTILVKGTNEGIELAKKKLAQLEERITCTEENFTEKKVIAYLEKTKNTRQLEIYAKAFNCVLSWESEESGMQIVFSNQQLQGKQRASDQVLLSPVLSTTVMSVDLLVLATAHEVQTLSGTELDKNFAFRAGLRIAKAKRSLPVMENIRYKSTILAAGPLYKGGDKGEEACLRATVMKCLKTASDRGYTSIALPSFSDKFSWYPVDEATRVVVEAVRLFIDTTSDSSIKEVKLYDKLQTTCDLFQTALDITSYIREPTTLNHVETLRTAQSQRRVTRRPQFYEESSLYESSLYESSLYESVSHELKLQIFAANEAEKKALLKDLLEQFTGGDCGNKEIKDFENLTTEKASFNRRCKHGYVRVRFRDLGLTDDNDYFTDYGSS